MIFRRFKPNTISSIILCLLVLVTDAYCFEFDKPEQQASGKVYKLADNVVLVVSAYRFGNFLYVFQDDKRVWKSPPLLGFCLSPKVIKKDIDGDGIKDFILSSKDCKYSCNEYMAYFSLSRQNSNFTMHYRRFGGGSERNQPIMETSEKISEETVELAKPWMMQFACDPEDVRPLFDSAQVTIRQDNDEAMKELKKIYAQSLSLFKMNGLLEKSEEYSPKIIYLDRFFEENDYRLLDAEQKDKEYTQILNDYGYFLDLAERREDAELVLTQVIKRDPERAAARLNIADVYFNQKTMKYTEHYKKYHDLMVAAGKKDKIPARVFDRMK